MLTKIGAALFGLGAILGITAGAKAPPHVGGFPDTVVFYVASLGVAIVGLVLWRRGRASKGDAEAEDRARGKKGAFDLLEGSVPAAKKLAAELGTLEAEAICDKVEAFLVEWILPLAEVRQRFIDLLGMAKGAEILVSLAYAERMFNRVWSAAGDGHLPEANRVMPEAVEGLEEAARLAAAAKPAEQARGQAPS